MVSSIVTSTSEKSFLFSAASHSLFLKLGESLNYRPGKRSLQTEFRSVDPSMCDKNMLRHAPLHRIRLELLARIPTTIAVPVAARFNVAVRCNSGPQIATAAFSRGVAFSCCMANLRQRTPKASNFAPASCWGSTHLRCRCAVLFRFFGRPVSTFEGLCDHCGPHCHTTSTVSSHGARHAGRTLTTSTM